MTDIPQPAFNLLDEPWIPARRQDGVVLDISLTICSMPATTRPWPKPRRPI